MFIIGCLGPALALDRMGRRKTMFFGGRHPRFRLIEL